MASEGANIRMTLSRDRCDREIDLISRYASKVLSRDRCDREIDLISRDESKVVI